VKNKIIELVNKIFNFFLLLPVYFIGLGMSKVLYEVFIKKKDMEGWKISEKLKKSLKYYEEML
jgi:hypothetical protein